MTYNMFDAMLNLAQPQKKHATKSWFSHILQPGGPSRGKSQESSVL